MRTRTLRLPLFVGHIARRSTTLYTRIEGVFLRPFIEHLVQSLNLLTLQDPHLVRRLLDLNPTAQTRPVPAQFGLRPLHVHVKLARPSREIL